MANVIFDTEAIQHASTGAQIAQMAARSVGNVAGSAYKTQENDFYMMQQKAKKAAATAALPMTVFYKLKKANEHSVTNIDLDQNYLERIGFDAKETKGISAQKAKDYTDQLHANAESDFQSRMEDKYFKKFDRSSQQAKLDSLDKIESSLHKDLLNAKRVGNRGLEENLTKQISAVRETKTALGTEITVTGKSTMSKMTSTDKLVTNARHYGVQQIRKEILGGENDHSLSQIETGGRMAHKGVDLTVKTAHKFKVGSIERQIASIEKQLVNAPHKQELLTKLSSLKKKQASLENAYRRYTKVSSALRGDFKFKKDLVKTGTKNAAKTAGKAAEKTAQKAATRGPKLKVRKGRIAGKKKPVAKFSKKAVSKVYKKAVNQTAKKSTEAAAKKVMGDAVKKNRWKAFFSRWGKKVGAAAKGSAAKAGAAAAAKGVVAKGGTAAVGSTPVGWIIAAVVVVLCMIIGFCSMAGGIAPIMMHYMSADISTNFGGAYDEGVNYCQAITNLVTYDLAAEMDLIQKTSAYDELTNKAYVGRMGIPTLPKDREDNKIYVWEEADNKTTWKDKNGNSTGVKIYADTYVADLSKRNSVTPYDNIVPIMNMMHMKMQDEIDYDSWHQALAYVYYMFAMSHNVNLFDAGADTQNYLYLYQADGNYSGYKLKKAYNGQFIYYHQNDYEEGIHCSYMASSAGGPRIEKNQNGEPICYNFQRNNNICNNEFYHDGENGGSFSAARIANLYQLRKIYGKRVEKYNNVYLMNYFNTAVLKSLCKGDPNAASYSSAEKQLKRLGFVVADENATTTFGKYAFIANEGNGSPYWSGIINLAKLTDGQPFTGVEENAFIDTYANNKTYDIEAYQTDEQHNYGTDHWQVCNHYITIGGNKNDIYQKNANGTYKKDIWDRLYLNDADFTWHFEDKGNNDAALNAFKNAHRSEINSGALVLIEDGQNYANLQNEMGVWKYQTAPDRFKAGKFAWTYLGYAVCLGHCGGHVYPTMDLIEMMTYEGLAQIDGFKTTRGESFESIVGPNVIEAAAKKIGVLFRIEDINEVNRIIKNEDGTSTPADILDASARANQMELAAIASFDEPLINSTNMREYLKTRYIQVDRDEIKSTIRTAETVSFLEWRAYWNDQAKRWFSIFPSSPKGLLQNISRKALYAAANLTDLLTKKLNQFKNWLISKLGGNADQPTSEEEDIGVIDEDNLMEDAFEFTGWFTEDGSGYDEDAMEELYDFYGGFYEDGFETSLDAWEGFEVQFDDKYIKLKDKEIRLPANYKPR